MSSDASNKICIASCNPTDPDDKYISIDKKSCVTTCGTDAINRAGVACVASCETGYI